MDKVAGINVRGLDRLILDINDYAERIKIKYNLIEELIENASECLKGDIGNQYKNRLILLKKNFSVINNNILSYSSDLSLVKKKYLDSVEKISLDFKRQN